MRHITRNNVATCSNNVCNIAGNIVDADVKKCVAGSGNAEGKPVA